jgi:cell division protein FtsW
MSRVRAQMDQRVLFYTGLLVCLGLITVYGATSYELTNDGEPFAYFSAHLQRVVVGLAAMLIAAWIPYRRSGRWATHVAWIALGLVALTLVDSPLRVTRHGISRWLRLGPIVFQPVELLKLSLVLALPTWIDENPRRLHSVRELAKLLVLPALSVLLLLGQPNFGSALAIVLITAALLWLGGIRAHHFIVLASAGIAAGVFAFNHHPKLYHRMLAWKGLLFHESYDSTWGYQAYQAVMGLGNGGLRGVAAGGGITRYEFLPEGHTDFIFAILGEEWGFIGALAVVILFGLLLARALRIAHRTRDGVGFLTASGIGVMISTYTLLNLAVVTSLFPVTGLPLPFFSYGGTALITNLAAIGVLLNISRNLPRRRDAASRTRRSG